MGTPHILHLDQLDRLERRVSGCRVGSCTAKLTSKTVTYWAQTDKLRYAQDVNFAILANFVDYTFEWRADPKDADIRSYLGEMDDEGGTVALAYLPSGPAGLRGMQIYDQADYLPIVNGGWGQFARAKLVDIVAHETDHSFGGEHIEERAKNGETPLSYPSVRTPQFGRRTLADIVQTIKVMGRPRFDIHELGAMSKYEELCRHQKESGEEE